MNKRMITILLAALSVLLNGGCTFSPRAQVQTTDEFVITIPGLKEEYHFLYITDSHVVSLDDKQSNEVQAYVKERYSSFADESGTASGEKLNSMLQGIDTDQYDGLLFGGDLIDSPTDANLDYLNKMFSSFDAPYLYTLGNHDWTFPWEYMTEKGQLDYLPKLSKYMAENTAIHKIEYDSFTIVSVDNSSNQINPSCMEEYKTILKADKPVILMLHVPLMTDSLLEEAKAVWVGGVVLGGGVNGGIYPNDVSSEFIQLTTAKNSPVVTILSGHVHFSHQSDVQGEKNIPQYVGGAGYQGISTTISVKGE